jgi:hypothetical protein
MSTKDHVAVRLDNETLLRIDAIRAQLDTKWRDATRSDVLRLLILKGLEHFEKKHGTALDKHRRAAPSAEAGAQVQKRGAVPRRGAATKASTAASTAPKRGSRKKGQPSA